MFEEKRAERRGERRRAFDQIVKIIRVQRVEINRRNIFRRDRRIGQNVLFGVIGRVQTRDDHRVAIAENREKVKTQCGDEKRNSMVLVEGTVEIDRNLHERR